MGRNRKKSTKWSVDELFMATFGYSGMYEEEVEESEDGDWLPPDTSDIEDVPF